MTESLEPRCVGRYLVDLPRDFVINPIAQTTVEGVVLKVEPMERERFDLVFSARAKWLQEQVLPGKIPGRPHLRATLALPGGGPGGVFDRSESHLESGRSARTLELWAWREGYRIEAHIGASDTSFPEDAGDSLVQQLPADSADKLARLHQVVARTRGRADLEVPAEPGVCLRNGFVAGPPTDHEWVDLHYHLSTAEDVYFTFHSLSDIGPQDTTLLQRGKAIEESLARVKGRTLRKGSRQGAGVNFDEWLMERESETKVKNYRFTLELNSKGGNAKAPLVVVDFSSGVRRPQPAPNLEEGAVLKPISQATLGEAESTALWDAVTATLRPRPGAF